MFKRHLDDTRARGPTIADESLAFMAVQRGLPKAGDRGSGLRREAAASYRVNVSLIRPIVQEKSACDTPVLCNELRVNNVMRNHNLGHAVLAVR